MIKRLLAGCATGVALLSATGCVQTKTQSQSQSSSVRTQNECELKALEGVGYRPVQEDYYYPRNLEAAEARLAQQNKARGLPPDGNCGAAAKTTP
jgi:hypothetical protein